jgi:hypothetical protein
MYCVDVKVTCYFSTVIMSLGLHHRRWGYDVKGVPKDQAKIMFASCNVSFEVHVILSFFLHPQALGL